MKQFLHRTAILYALSVVFFRLSAQSFAPISSPSYPFVRAECEGGGNHYILFEKGSPSDTEYLYRFDGNNFYAVDSFEVSNVYCMFYDNNEIYFGGLFGSVNSNIFSHCVFKYSLSNKTITTSADILGANITTHSVFDIKKWNNQLLMCGMFDSGGVFTPLIKGSGASCTPFDNSIYGNQVCQLTNKLEQITIESDSSFYITGSIKYIDQLEVNAVAYYNHGQWTALGSGLTNDKLFGNHRGGIAKQFGKLFEVHNDSLGNYIISYFDGNNWATLNNPSTGNYNIVGHSCGLIVYSDNFTVTPNGVELYNSQLAGTPLAGATTTFVSKVFEHNGSAYVYGTFIVNGITYKFGRIDCISLGLPQDDDAELTQTYSNPFHNQLTFNVFGTQPTTASLYDFLGRQILQETFTNSAIINTEQLANGIYFYALRNSKGTLKTGKVVKQ